MRPDPTADRPAYAILAARKSRLHGPPRPTRLEQLEAIDQQTPPKRKGGFKKGKSGNPAGRRPGSQNIATKEAREMAASIIDDPVYLENLRAACIDRSVSPVIEAMLWAYAKGRPPEKHEISGAGGAPLAFTWLPPVLTTPTNQIAGTAPLAPASPPALPPHDDAIDATFAPVSPDDDPPNR